MTRRRTVSANADHTLTAWLDEVMEGQLRLQELPLCVSAWYFAGESYGRESRQSEIDQLTQRIRALEHQLDSAWLQAYSPKDRREIYQRRLDDHFRQRDADFFAEPGQLNNGTRTLDPAMRAEIEGTNGGSSTPGRWREAA